MKIGVDIGGTTAKIGLIDDENNLLEKTSVETYADSFISLTFIAEAIENLLEKNQIPLSKLKGIGIGVPGTVSQKTGTIDFLSNLGWKKVKICEFFENRFNVKTAVDNDASVATNAELKLGRGKTYKNFICLTLGTGIGGGIVLNGEIFSGAEGKGAEIGHMVIDCTNGEPCGCGRKGCFETKASATALVKMAKENMLDDKKSMLWDETDRNIDSLNGKIIIDCVKNGDNVATKTFEQYIENLGVGLLNLMNIFRPDAIVLCGGISNAGDLLTTKVNKYCRERKFGYEGTPPVNVVTTALKDNAGVLGAGLLID